MVGFMKITIIKSYNSNMHFAQRLKTEKTNNQANNNSKRLICNLVGVCAVGVAGLYMLKSLRSRTAQCVMNSFLTENDKNYLNSINESLKNSGIDVKVENLKSIVAPDEFKSLIRKYKPEHFRVGLQISEAKSKDMPLDKFYKNVIDGNFRISLHTHSNFSDGKASVEEFLESARKYADKVAKMNKNDGLPPFVIALTDHDSVKGCQEAIKIIAQNPDKYKNLKFVAGCEFSVANGYNHHDITGLALNPFDKKLVNILDDLSNTRINTVKNFLEKQPLFNNKKITYEELVKFEKDYYSSKKKDGKRCIENASGIVSVRHAVDFFYKMTGQSTNRDIMDKLGDKDILPVETVIKTIKDNGGYASLTHPTKSFWRYIGDDFILKLKKMGLDGIEVNHQYTPSKVTKVGQHNGNILDADDIFEEITKKYKIFANNNGLFLSGGTDSHEKQIFSREPKITKEILEKIYN